MAQVLVTESYLDDIADAIRDKTGSEDTYTPAQMAGAIEALPDAPVLVQKSITANGSYDPEDDSADGYSEVTVNVPNTYTASDEGKVVDSGALVAQGSDTVTENDTYDTTLISSLTVNVEGGGSGGDKTEILYNSNFSLNTTGVTSWDGTNSGTSGTSRIRIIDGWEIMQCTAEKTASGLKVVPKMQYAYLTATIPAYWFLNKTVTIYAVVNGTKYEMTGALSSNGASVSYNTPFGQLYFYAYNAFDIVFTLSFNNQIDQEFVISDTSMKLSASS